jgi:hypothetical protein
MAITFDDLPDEQVAAPKGITFDDLPDEAKPAGFAQRMASDFKKRQENFAPNKDLMRQGKLAPLEYEINALGQGTGLMGDFAGNVVGSAARYAGDLIPEAIKEPVKNVGVSLYNYASDSAVGDVARDYTNSYQGFAQENPRLDRFAGSLLNIGGLGAAATPIKGVSAASAAVDAPLAVAKAGKRAAISGVEKLATPARVMPNSEQLAGMGVTKFNEARTAGEVFDAPLVTNKFIESIDVSKGKKIAGTVETDLSQALESGLGKYRDLANKPLGIDEIDIIDKDLSNLKDQAYNAGKNQLGSELSNIQNALRGSVADSPSGATLAEARDLFRRKYQMEDVERIFRNAEGRPNEAAIIQTGYRNLANQARKKGSGYTKQQIMLMDKAAKGGLSIDALKLLSSKLIPVVAGASGNFAGAGAAYMGNLAAGAGATALQTAKANKLAKSITKGITVEAEPNMVNRMAQRLLTPKEIGQLPPAEAKAYLQLTGPKQNGGGFIGQPLPEATPSVIYQNGPAKPLQIAAPESAIEVTPQGSARMQSQAARDAGIKARARGQETGLTLDVRKAQGAMYKANSPSMQRQLDNPPSYVVRDKATGQPVMETFSKEVAAKVNTDKYEVVPILEHLANQNGQSYAVKSAASAPKEFSQFIEVAKKSTSPDDFIKRAREIKGISPDTAEWFQNKYAPNGGDMRQAVSAFLKETNMKKGK